MGDPVFGTQLPVQAQSVVMSTEEWEADAGTVELAIVARAFDRHGFDYVGVCEHVAIPREVSTAMSTTWFDTVATLGWLAGITTRVKLLSHILVAPYHHPAQIAKAFSTLDALSGGRAILGLGAGHLRGEFDLLGADYDRRTGRLVDTVGVVRAAFTDEWGLGEFGQRPRPLQPGGPPIWVGGSTHAALRRAGELGDGWLPEGPPKQGLTAAIAALRRAREEAGRADLPFAVNSGLMCYIGEPGWDTGKWCLAGQPEAVAEAVRKLAGRGVTHIQVRFRSRGVSELTDQIAAFAADVVPLARG
jgi:probable F420-dependent oxidoreductase